MEPESFDHHVLVIRAKVVSPQCQKELTHGALFFVSIMEGQQKNKT